MAIDIPKKLIIITGPTAIGKTALSIQLARHYECPVISFDSRQFYKEMNIGTAKPTAEELAQAEHHFVGNLSIKDHYTAGMYEQAALDRLSKIYTTHNYCIAVGGSGLYIDALAFGIDDIPADESIREVLQARWKTEGLEKLAEEVKTIDPDFYASSDMKNSRRVIRALEVHQITGKTYTELRKRSPKKRPFDMHWIGLNVSRELLFERINTRVDLMMEHGLLKEVESLLPERHYKALKTVGYREFFDYFDGECKLEKAVELVKRNTRHYAKRQITWFKKNGLVKWYLPQEKEKIIEEIGK